MAKPEVLAPGPMKGITQYNYLQLGKAFMQMNGPFLIVRDRFAKPPVDPGMPGWPPTPREWGAWRAWRKSKNLPSAYTEKVGYATVPARWPHLFDADWPEHKSVDAANRWQDQLEKRP